MKSKVRDVSTSSSPRKHQKKEKWCKLLNGKRFYIHLPESPKTQRLEKRLNFFGGIVDKFFHKDINFVISSEEKRLTRKEYNTRANILAKRHACVDNMSRYETRTASVVKNIHSKYTSQYREVIKAAQNWGINVKSFLAVNQWLNLVEERMKAVQTLRETPRVRRLKGTFVKVEDFNRNYKPLVKEFDVWPELHIDSRPCPFDQEANNKSKAPPKCSERDFKNKPGYCEPCQVTYNNLGKHLQGTEHKTFARNHVNFRSLDKLICRGPSVDDLRQVTKRKRAPTTN